MDTLIRAATADDLPQINEIYNYYVENSTATYEEQPVLLEKRREWWRVHAARFAVLVAADGANVIGWACLTAYNDRCAYRSTVEDSIYLRPEACGRGVGRLLLGALLAEARSREFHTVIAKIDSGSVASVRLHAALGFREVGRLREVGFKFGRWLDGVLMQLML